LRGHEGHLNGCECDNDETDELVQWETGISPFASQQEVELVAGTGDKDDKLALMLAPPAHGIETGVAEGVEKTRILVFGLLGLLSSPLL
jgi:hypothetical protein